MNATNHNKGKGILGSEEMSRPVGPQAVHLLRQVLEEKQVTIRFDNGYGGTIFRLAGAGEEEIYGVWVLRFHGPGPDDCDPAQYAPIPELNRGNFAEILDLCRQVSLLPPPRGRAGIPGQLRSWASGRERSCGGSAA